MLLLNHNCELILIASNSVACLAVAICRRAAAPYMLSLSLFALRRWCVCYLQPHLGHSGRVGNFSRADEGQGRHISWAGGSCCCTSPSEGTMHTPQNGRYYCVQFRLSWSRLQLYPEAPIWISTTGSLMLPSCM
jgi:hypothetical protein